MTDVILSKTVEGFLLTKSASGRSPNNIRDYGLDISRFIEIVGGKEISSIANTDIEKYLHYLKNDFCISQQAVTPIKPRKIPRITLHTSCKNLLVFNNTEECKSECMIMCKIIAATMSDVG